MKKFKVITFSLVFLSTYTAIADCPVVNVVNDQNAAVINSSSFDTNTTIFLSANADGSNGVSISITSEAGNTIGSLDVGLNQYTQLTTSAISLYDYVHGGQAGAAFMQPTYKQLGDIGVWNLTDGTQYVVIRSAELDNSLSTTVLTKDSGSSTFVSQCYPSSLNSFVYDDLVSQIFARMTDPVSVNLSDYSPTVCDGATPFCTGTFIGSPVLYYSSDGGGVVAANSSSKSLITRANEVVSMALRSSGPVNRKNLLKRASVLCNDYLLTKPRAKASSINKLKKAVKLSLKSTRKNAADSEVSSSLRTLKSAIKSFI